MRPDVHPTTERLYDQLPELYRRADDDQADGPNGYPLLRFLSLTGDLLGDLEDLIDRIQYIPTDEGGAPGDTSDLADADAADEAWLTWLAQLVGVRLEPKLTTAEKRDAVRYASAGWRAGTKTAVADAAKTVLTGTKYARVYDHATTRQNAGTQSQWDVLIVTRPSETPDVGLVLATVVAKGAKPAGVVLHHEAYSATWATLATARPAWADWHAAASWRDLEETV
jgi:hypothetical protein